MPDVAWVVDWVAGVFVRILNPWYFFVSDFLPIPDSCAILLLGPTPVGGLAPPYPGGIDWMSGLFNRSL